MCEGGSAEHHHHHRGRHHDECCSQREDRGVCDCGCGGDHSEHGAPCCYGGHHGFHRRYTSKAEVIAELEEYLAELKAEAQAVEERLNELRA